MLLAAAAPSPAGAQQGPQFPKLTGRVTDAADIIPADVEARIDGKLAALEAQKGSQLVVVTVPGLQGYDIADYGYQLGRHWGIGSQERNDGALLIVAPNERELRIEVGYGLEGVLTDGMSSLIINQTIVPRFKAGDMAGGIEAGTDAIITQLGLPEADARRVAQQAGTSADTSADSAMESLLPALFFGLIFLIQFVIPFFKTVRQRRRHPGAAGSIFLWDLLRNMPRISTSSGGGGGGGGFSGGGGSFGGGGASGRW